MRIRDEITQVLGTGFIKHTEALEWCCESITIHLESGPRPLDGLVIVYSCKPKAQQGQKR